MKLDSLFVSAVLSGLAVLSGCASDPNKKVDSAETNLANEHQKAIDEQAALDRKQADERAQKQDVPWDKQAELQRKQESQQAEQRADAKTDITDARKDVVQAHANMAAERTEFDAKVKERLTKADAKAKELKTKSAKLGGKKATVFRDNYTLYTQQRTEVQAQCKTLATMTDDGWSSTKTNVDRKLDSLESTLGTMGEDL